MLIKRIREYNDDEDMDWKLLVYAQQGVLEGE
jgi:hypothetical protein